MEPAEYNAKRGLFERLPPIDDEKALANQGEKGRTVPLMHHNQAGPEPFAERVSP